MVPGRHFQGVYYIRFFQAMILLLCVQRKSKRLDEAEKEKKKSYFKGGLIQECLPNGFSRYIDTLFADWV